MRAIHKQVPKATPAPRVHAPNGQSVCRTKTEKLKALMKRQWVTALEGAHKVGIISVGQRAGQFRKQGLKVIDKWISRNGSRFKAWRIVG